MKFRLGDYLQPTPLLNELSLLARLSERPNSSQAALGSFIGLAPAMINTYLRRFEEAGLIERIHRDGRGIDYRLTSEGERKRAFHVITFLAQLYSLFDQVLDDLRERVIRACGQAPMKVILYGAGETGLMTYLALQSVPHITITGVIDDDSAKIGTSFFEFRVRNSNEIVDIDANAILVASWSYSEKMLRDIQPIAAANGMRVVRLTP